MTMKRAKELIAVAGARIARQEASLLIEMLDQALKSGGRNHTELDILQLVKAKKHSTAFALLALYINRCSRELSLTISATMRAPLIRPLLYLRENFAAIVSSAPAEESLAPEIESQGGVSCTLADAITKVYQISVGRSPVPAEIDIWKNHFNTGLPFHDFFLSMCSGPEAQKHAQHQAVLPGVSDGEYVQKSYELILGRGAAAWEIELWLRKLEEGSVTRAGMLAELFDSANNFFTAQIDAVPHDGLSCLVMGTGTHVTAADWQGQAQVLREAPPKQPDTTTRYANRFYIKGKPRVLVSALASMYRGGDFIEQFMDNITRQDSFDDYCELVIVDADSPENEYKTIKRYLARHKNINYIRCNYRIGIYDAWNVAAKAARGEYLTNTNMDDLRRHDSFELQAAVLDNLPFVDVVYQDLYYTFDPRLSFAEIAAFGLQTTLPVITPHNMIQFNSPHNAPMWRKRLHEELGYFDTRYKSAGDYEFWMRCLAAGKKFYRINDPHVVYYQNPKGLSTRPDTRGVVEAMEVHEAYCRKLIPQDVVMPREQFIRKLDPSVSGWVIGDTKDRYVLAQQALRNAARHRKYPTKQGAKS